MVVRDKLLEVAHLIHLTIFAGTLNQRVHLNRVFRMLGQHFLDLVVVEQNLLGESENLESLLPGHKTAFNPESLLCNLLATRIAILLSKRLVSLLVEVLANLFESLSLSKRSNILHILFRIHVRVEILQTSRTTAIRTDIFRVFFLVFEFLVKFLELRFGARIRAFWLRRERLLCFLLFDSLRLCGL